MLVDRSDNMGIETYAVATFPEVPAIVIEDYYTNSINFLTELRERNLPFPVKICVADEQAKEAILEVLPELDGSIEVTGQPALDRFAQEDTKTLAIEIKSKLGLEEDDKLVSFMSTIDGIEKITKLAEALKNVATDQYYFAFRKHPRDSVAISEYEDLLRQVGINVIDTEGLTTDEVNIASDVVLTTWSTEGLHAVYRGKPTVHFIDSEFPIPEGLTLPLPYVRSGASVGIESVDEIRHLLPQLLNKESEVSLELEKNIKEQYHLDGKNSERVADVVRKFL